MAPCHLWYVATHEAAPLHGQYIFTKRELRRVQNVAPNNGSMHTDVATTRRLFSNIFASEEIDEKYVFMLPEPQYHYDVERS